MHHIKPYPLCPENPKVDPQPRDAEHKAAEALGMAEEAGELV